jgi:predicted nucleic acid-binding protein
MRVMADTNIYISMLLFPVSLPAKVLLHIADNHILVLCDHIVMEIRDVDQAATGWPGKKKTVSPRRVCGRYRR